MYLLVSSELKYALIIFINWYILRVFTIWIFAGEFPSTLRFLFVLGWVSWGLEGYSLPWINLHITTGHWYRFSSCWLRCCSKCSCSGGFGCCTGWCFRCSGGFRSYTTGCCNFSCSGGFWWCWCCRCCRSSCGGRYNTYGCATETLISLGIFVCNKLQYHGIVSCGQIWPCCSWKIKRVNGAH